MKIVKFRPSRNTIFIFYPTLTQTTEPIFTIVLHDIEQLVELLMHKSARQWCISFQNTRAKSEDSQFWPLQKSPKINWLPIAASLGLVRNLFHFYNPHTYIHQSWNVHADRFSSCWDIRWGRPLFAVSFQKYKFLTPQSLALLDHSSPYLYMM